MKKQALLAALFLTTAVVPAAFAANWWDGKYEAGHHYTYDEWKDHRASWEGEHKTEKHWDDAHMRKEWENHKHHYHY
jgi:hypothetical protein